ncbi:MAG: glyoxalase [Bacteroidota bacterium]|nr:glyoxalase [Bacteroidota bacterium]
MRIKKLIVQTSALKDLTDFYIRLMELPASLSAEKELAIKIGSTELVFQQATAAGPFYHFAINIPANKIEDARTWIRNRVDLVWIEQYQSDIADFVNWHARSVYFYDPAGNILELIARFDLDTKTSNPFSSGEFLSISEAGLVFPENELEKRTGNLLHQYPLSYFDKQPPLPQFKALGDDEGLLIIVPEGRNWFPTTRPAGIFPMKILFENGDKKYELKV